MCVLALVEVKGSQILQRQGTGSQSLPIIELFEFSILNQVALF
jgi:hypothetical protein